MTIKTNENDVGQHDSHQDVDPPVKEIIHTEEVIIGTEQGMMFPTWIGATICNALIDTGATRSCISDKFYQCLPTFDMQNVGDISVRSATGSNLTPLGMINCSFELGNLQFVNNLVVCRNLTHPLILGRDFLMQHHITIQYDANGKCVLAYQQQEIVASVELDKRPQIFMAHSVTIPGRSLAIVSFIIT